MKSKNEAYKVAYTKAITNVLFRLNRGWLSRYATLPTSADIVFVRFGARPEFPAVVVNHCARYVWEKGKNHFYFEYVKRVEVDLPVMPKFDENGAIIEKATLTAWPLSKCKC